MNKEEIEEKIKELQKEYDYQYTLANFHQKMACSEYFAEHSDFYLKKMKECDDLCNKIGERITQLCQKNK
jgi:hypothetical protein